jgi:hypothetical protein
LGTYSLVCHPDTPARAVRSVQVDWDEGAVLTLCWRVVGAGALVVPAPVAAPARTDGLWQATCFELFLKTGEAYREVNLSPSGHWAAYDFTGYRAGMVDAPVAPPRIACKPGESFTLTATLAGLVPGPTRASLTAVIEEEGGHKSYWALAHGPGKPDFHAPSCFILPLEAPPRA